MPVLLESTYVLQSSLVCSDIFALLEEPHTDAVTGSQISAVKNPYKATVRNESGFMLQTQDIQQLALCLCSTNKKEWTVQGNSSQPFLNWTSCQHLAFMGNLTWATHLRKLCYARGDLGICSRFGMGSTGMWWKGFGITHGDEHCAFCK